MLSLLKEKASENKQLARKLKKLEEKYVELNKREKGLVKDRETFIQFLHLVFPVQMLEEVLLPETVEAGLYDIEHLKQFWTHLKTQSENESVNIIAVMKEEKLFLMQKIHSYEKESGEKAGLERRQVELESTVAQLNQELSQLKRTLQIKDAELLGYQEKVEEGDELSERVRQLERENSELKAAKLMSMFGAPVAPQPQQALEKQLEALRLQLSEKTNDFLRLKEDYDLLRDQGQPLHPVQEETPVEEVNTSSI
jgi:hypothetical protein